MSKTKHTPGPFRQRNGNHFIIEDQYGDAVADCDLSDHNGGAVFERTEIEANARLFAAAPDLKQELIYAANELETLVQCLEKGYELPSVGTLKLALAEARAAIAKAEGRE